MTLFLVCGCGDGSDLIVMDIKRDQLETRVATLELMLVTERSRPQPSENKIADLERELPLARMVLEKYAKKKGVPDVKSV